MSDIHDDIKIANAQLIERIKLTNLELESRQKIYIFGECTIETVGDAFTKPTDPE